MQDNKQQADQAEQETLSPEVKIGKNLVETLDALLDSGDWESSLFLRTIRRKIKSIMEEASSIIEGEQKVEEAGSQNKFKQLLPSGYVRIYILLYQTEGNKLSSWQNALKTLLDYNISRPIYCDESHVQELVRSKKDVERYGYAVVNVLESNIYPQEQLPIDQFNHKMIILRENSIKRENVIGFVHANKKRYGLVEGELVYQGDIE